MKMNKDSEDLPLTFYSRHRSPSFDKNEIETLVNLIEKFKNIVMNKSTTNPALHAKDVVWAKITKQFNSQGFKHTRNTESLKMKWFNLKKEARRISKNLIEMDNENFDELTRQIVTMISDTDNVEIFDPNDLNTAIESEEPIETKDAESNVLKENSEEDGSPDAKKRFSRNRTARSLNFSPQECRILIKCVRSEKRIVFSKANSTKAIQLKALAWARITQSFNKLSPHKRSTKMLQNKFLNMKRLARSQKRNVLQNDSNGVYVKMEDTDNDTNNDTSYEIKSEPTFEHENDASENSCVEQEDSCNEDQAENNQRLPLDPLSTVLNTDSGLGFSNSDYASFSENKEIVKLKMELLQYQLENAKLERKRIEEAIRAESEARQARATETALRLRAARLEAVAAATKVMLGHPALAFTPEEALAQQYLGQYHQA